MDDWSLKGKEVNSTLLIPNDEMIFEKVIRLPERWKNKKSYLKSDIETLHQKLIEDIDWWLREYTAKSGHIIFYKSLVDKINKRFGVDG